MKVRLPDNYRDDFSLADLERAKALIQHLKEDDEGKPADWARYAVNEALKGTNDYLDEIITAEAITARNCKVWDMYADTRDMDVLISALAKTARGYMEIEAYLSDIWQTSPEYDYRDRMYYRMYLKQER